MQVSAILEPPTKAQLMSWTLERDMQLLIWFLSSLIIWRSIDFGVWKTWIFVLEFFPPLLHTLSSYALSHPSFFLPKVQGICKIAASCIPEAFWGWCPWYPDSASLIFIYHFRFSNSPIINTHWEVHTAIFNGASILQVTMITQILQSIRIIWRT